MICLLLINGTVIVAVYGTSDRIGTVGFVVRTDLCLQRERGGKGKVEAGLAESTKRTKRRAGDCKSWRLQHSASSILGIAVERTGFWAAFMGSDV